MVVDEAEESSGVEEKKSSNTRMPVELANGFRKHRTAELAFLNQSLRFGEAAGVTGFAAIDGNGVNHAVTVEEMVARDGFKQGVGAISEIDPSNAIRNGPDDGEGVLDWLFRDGSEVSRYLNAWVGSFGERVLELA